MVGKFANFLPLNCQRPVRQMSTIPVKLIKVIGESNANLG
jgi:hypothetical protein